LLPVAQKQLVNPQRVALVANKGWAARCITIPSHKSGKYQREKSMPGSRAENAECDQRVSGCRDTVVPSSTCLSVPRHLAKNAASFPLLQGAGAERNQSCCNACICNKPVVTAKYFRGTEAAGENTSVAEGLWDGLYDSKRRKRSRATGEMPGTIYPSK
jgi:hypothetical protein